MKPNTLHRNWNVVMGLLISFLGVGLCAWGADGPELADAYDLLTILNAARAARWHVVANQTGLIGQAQCYGHSRIVDPRGLVIQETGVDEGMVIWATDIPIPAGTWVSRKQMPAPAVTCASCTVDGLFYVMGGHDERTADHALTNVWAYDPRTDEWAARAPLPSPRHFLGQCAAAVDGNIYVVGGYGMGAPGPIIREVVVYNPKTDTWTNGAPMPTGRGSLTACAVDGIVYAIGGGIGASKESDVVEAYDPKATSGPQSAAFPRHAGFSPRALWMGRSTCSMEETSSPMTPRRIGGPPWRASSHRLAVA